MIQRRGSAGRYDEARLHLQNAINSGGLNEEEISGLRYQNAQLYMSEGRWKEGAAALEKWFKTAASDSAAYYLLAAAYYEIEDYDRALPAAKKAVELMSTPQEGWIGMLLALYMQRESFKEAVPLLLRLIEISPEKKVYWLQLSAVYGQLDDYPDALAIMQLAYGAKLLTEDSELRLLADLQLFNGVPYRCGQMLEAGIEAKTVTIDDKLYDKLANCWIAAGELDRALPVCCTRRSSQPAATRWYGWPSSEYRGPTGLPRKARSSAHWPGTSKTRRTRTC